MPSMTPRKTQDERSEATRERLLSAAVKILSDQGYANFRIAEVSNVSGVSRGGMIHHYPSKDALVADVLEYVFARILRRSEAKLSSVSNTASALSTMATRQPPSPAELKRMLAFQGGNLRRLFNTSGIQYRALGLAAKLPGMSEADSLPLLAGEGRLVKRPFALGEKFGLVGFDPESWNAQFGK